MYGAIWRSIYPPYSTDGVIGAADALCKMHGPKGLGQFVNFNTTLSQWVSQSNTFSLNEKRTADLEAFGRIWNEGLAFYGWIFYISKFYEIVDTLIILAKGKNSGLLQSYHHAGAILSMWSGIRYMSPPIWLFVFLNSAIHTIMVSRTILFFLGKDLI